MNSIQQIKDYLKTFNDEKLLDEYDLYLSVKSKGIKEIIFQQLIENELNDRDLLTFKINEDQFESHFNQVSQ
jgi:hypothetical protein